MKMDDELKALRSCVSAIDDLPLESRARVAAFVFERYGDTTLYTQVLKSAVEKLEAFDKWRIAREEEVNALIQLLRTMPITPRDDEPIARRMPQARPSAIEEIFEKLKEPLPPISALRPEPDPPNAIQEAAERMKEGLSPKEQDLLKTRFGIGKTPSVQEAQDILKTRLGIEKTRSAGGEEGGPDVDINNLGDDEEEEEAPALVAVTIPPPADEDGLVEV